MNKLNINGYRINNEREVVNMMYASNYIENIIYSDDSIKKECVKKEKKKSLLAKFEMLLFMKNIKQIYRDKKFKLYEKFENRKEVLSGKTVIKGTRIEPKVIVNYILKMSNIDAPVEEILNQLLNDYPSITKEDAIASLIYEIAHTSYFKILFHI